MANQDAKVRNQLQDLDSLTKFPETQFDVPFVSKTIVFLSLLFQKDDRMNQILISNKPSEHTQMVTKGILHKLKCKICNVPFF